MLQLRIRIGLDKKQSTTSPATPATPTPEPVPTKEFVEEMSDEEETETKKLQKRVRNGVSTMSLQVY